MSSRMIFKLLFLLSTAYLAVLPFNIMPILYLLRIPSLFLIVMLVLKKYNKVEEKCLLSVIIMCGIFIFHFIADTPITIELLLSAFSIAAYLSLIIVSEKVTLDYSTKNFINVCSIVAALILLIYSQSPWSHIASFEGEFYENPYLTYGYENSNFAGIVTLLVFSLVFITKDNAGKKVKAICWILDFLLFYCIYKTNTRSALSVAILIPIFDLFLREIRLRNWFVTLVCLIPFLFVPFYMNLSSTGSADDIQIMGKGAMSGRQFVYEAFLNRMYGAYEWIIGNFADNKLHNAHNGPLAILASTGLLGSIAYFNVFFSKLFHANKQAISHMNALSVFIIVACFLNTCGEAALLLGGFPAITYLFTFFVFAYSKQNKI